MAHSLSAKKRIRQNQTQNAYNRWRKRQVKGAVKAFDQAVHAGDANSAQEAYRAASRTLDTVAAKGVIHKNAAARTKSRLAARLNAMAAT